MSYLPFLAEIRLFPLNFAPVGWKFCNGQQMPIAEYQALYALLGTQYGGDGETYFNLPDFRGRAPLGWGQSRYSEDVAYKIGAAGGQETRTLPSVPEHNHYIIAMNVEGSEQSPEGNMPAAYIDQIAQYQNTLYAEPSNTTFDPEAVGSTGSAAAFSNMAPFGVANYCICTDLDHAIWPPRS